jgi:hypothetical protein
MNGQWVSVAGLCFDALGAGIMARAGYIGQKEYQAASVSVNRTTFGRTTVDLTPVTSVLRKAGIQIAQGFGVSCIGFALQIIGGIMQALTSPGLNAH